MDDGLKNYEIELEICKEIINMCIENISFYENDKMKKRSLKKMINAFFNSKTKNYSIMKKIEKFLQKSEIKPHVFHMPKNKFVKIDPQISKKFESSKYNGFSKDVLIHAMEQFIWVQNIISHDNERKLNSNKTNSSTGNDSYYDAITTYKSDGIYQKSTNEPEPPKFKSNLDIYEYIMKKEDRYLSSIEKNAIKTAIPSIEESDIFYYSIETLEKLKSIDYLSNELSENKDLSLTKKVSMIVEIAELIYETLSKYLLSFNSDLDHKLSELFNKFNPNNYLSQYTKLYEEYIKFYDKLSSEDKTTMDNNFNNLFSSYKIKFNITGSTARDVVTPNELKKSINNNVKNKLVKDYKYSFRKKVDNYNFLSFATKYMTPAEITGIYSSIHEEIYRYSFNLTEEEQKQMQESDAIMQEVFARAIASRIKYNEDGKTEEQLLEAKEKDLVAICNKFFKEEVKFETYYFKGEQVKTDIIEKKLEKAEVIKEAELRYYGLSKLKRTFLVVSDWKKLLELRKKDVLTDSEIESVKKMF